MNFLKKFCAAWSLPLTKSNCLRRCSKHKGFQVSNDSVAQWMLFFLHFTFSKDYREASFVSIRPILLEIRIFWKKTFAPHGVLPLTKSKHTLLKAQRFFKKYKIILLRNKHFFLHSTSSRDHKETSFVSIRTILTEIWIIKAQLDGYNDWKVPFVALYNYTV